MALGVNDSGLTARQSTLEAEKKHALDLNRAKSELIANVSHEILNPLNSIMGFSEILENELEDNFYRGCASTIRENGRFLLEIMNDLMDVTRIENNRLPLLLEAVNPWDIILSVRDLMQILARDKNLPLMVQRDENAPESIVTEPKRLRQILINLVGNGIKFTESGSITIRLGRLLDEDPQGFQIDVIDTGIGIQSEEMDNLFEAFVRGSNHKSAGAGLGLSICRKLSRHLQGELILESKVGQGSKFTLKLPVFCKEV
jgi:signal transduction histidine kinase